MKIKINFSIKSQWENIFNKMNKFTKEQGLNKIKHEDLKKIIFSFLNIEDQRSIYWSNKKLRHLLPNSSLAINIKSLKTRSFLEMNDEYPGGLLDLPDGTLAYWSREGINLIKYNNSKKSFEKLKNIPYEIYFPSSICSPIITKDNCHIIYPNGNYELGIWDLNFNFAQSILEYEIITSLCSLSSSSFAVGGDTGIVKIYNLNKEINQYELNKSVALPYSVYCFLYNPKNDYILCGSYHGMINICYPLEINMRNVTAQGDYIVSLISINDEMFASSYRKGKIKIWLIKDYSEFECKKTITAYDEIFDEKIMLKLFGKEFLVIYIINKPTQFKIWNLKTFECVKIFEKANFLECLTVTHNNTMILVTSYPSQQTDKYLLHEWKISE